MNFVFAAAAQGIDFDGFVFLSQAIIGFNQSDSGKFKINYGSYVGEAAHFVMTTGGNVGIGTTAPGAKLDVAGTGNFTGTVTAPTFSGNLSGTATYANSAGSAPATWSSQWANCYALAISTTANSWNYCRAWEVDTGLTLDSERTNPQRAYVPVVTAGSFMRYGSDINFRLTPTLFYVTCYMNQCNNYARVYLSIACAGGSDYDYDYSSPIYWKIFEIK